MAKVNLNDRALRSLLEQHLEAAVDKAALGMLGHIRQKISVSARSETPDSRRNRINARKKAGLKSARFLYEPSKPGEPPRKRKGKLRDSLAREVKREGDQVIARMGAKVPYAAALEYGTRKMAARPYLRPSLTEYGRTFHNIVVTEMKRRLK